MAEIISSRPMSNLRIQTGQAENPLVTPPDTAPTAGASPIPIIHDGDHGSDDFLASLVALGRKDALNLLGITTCHGNVSVVKATRNACAAVDIAGPDSVPVVQGAASPWKMSPRSGDDAFGSDGLGGVALPEPVTKPFGEPAHVWLIKILRRTPRPVTICITGPMTNIARLLEEAPNLRAKIARIVAMGGCLGPLGPSRRGGNITALAEFNFYMDPDAAAYTLQSGIPMVLLPMDVTHQLAFSDRRKSDALHHWPEPLGGKLVQMLSAAEALDREKFGMGGAAIHDPQVMAYLLAPQLYHGRMASLTVNTDNSSTEHGRLLEDKGAKTQVLLIEHLVSPNEVFEVILDAVRRVLLSRS